LDKFLPSVGEVDMVLSPEIYQRGTTQCKFADDVIRPSTGLIFRGWLICEATYMQAYTVQVGA